MVPARLCDAHPSAAPPTLVAKPVWHLDVRLLKHNRNSSSPNDFGNTTSCSETGSRHCQASGELEIVTHVEDVSRRLDDPKP